jgi:hypothetical protein
VTFFLPRLIKPCSKLSSFTIQNNRCVDSYRLSAFFAVNLVLLSWLLNCYTTYS